MKLPRKVGAVLALLMVLGAGIFSCNGRDPVGDLRSVATNIGNVDGPSAADFSEMFSLSCLVASINCDGVIEPVMVGGKAKGLPDSHDDDLWALAYVLVSRMPFVEGMNDLVSIFNERREEFFGGLVSPGQNLTFGPFSGTLDLDEACRSGSGNVLRIVLETYAAFALTDAHVETWVTFDACRVEGALDDIPGDDALTLTGTMTFVEDFDGFSAEGFVTINPGLAGPTGSGPTPIWGYDDTLSFDMGVLFGSMGVEAVGGVCYGGITPTAEGCEGIFLSYQEYLDAEHPPIPN